MMCHVYGKIWKSSNERSKRDKYTQMQEAGGIFSGGAATSQKEHMVRVGELHETVIEMII